MLKKIGITATPGRGCDDIDGKLKKLTRILAVVMFVILFSIAGAGEGPGEKKGESSMQCKIVKKITMGHCARGFANCAKCRESYIRRYCLLDICPKGDFARPVTEVEIDGSKTWKPYDTLKVFSHYEEAQAYAQANHVPFEEDILTLEDAVLEKLKNRLPAHWTMSIANENLVIESQHPVTVFFTNRLNAPPPVYKKNPPAPSQDQQGRGQQVHQRFVFRLENRWYPERFAKIKRDNEAVCDEIDQLPEKLEISHIYRPMSKTVEGMFRPQTPAEQDRVNQYEQEKEELTKKISPLPGYLSEKYSLFFVKSVGMVDEYTEVQPASAVEEMTRIESIFKEVFEIPE